VSGYIFSSYELEQWVANQYFYGCSTVRDYLFSCIGNLALDWSSAQWRKDKLERAKQIVNTTKQYESEGYPIAAEQEVKKLIPSA